MSIEALLNEAIDESWQLWKENLRIRTGEMMSPIPPNDWIAGGVLRVLRDLGVPLDELGEGKRMTPTEWFCRYDGNFHERFSEEVEDELGCDMVRYYRIVTDTPAEKESDE